MDSIWIRGGATLNGDIPISGAKNAALTLIPCALLTDDKLTLANLPRLADVDSFSHLMNQLGVSTSVAGVKKGEFGRKVITRPNSSGRAPSTVVETPSWLRRWPKLSTSARRGKLPSVSFSSVSSAQGSRVSALFFALEIWISPSRRFPPWIQMLSTAAL